jgi:hypothetical protein
MACVRYIMLSSDLPKLSTEPTKESVIKLKVSKVYPSLIFLKKKKRKVTLKIRLLQSLKRLLIILVCVGIT